MKIDLTAEEIARLSRLVHLANDAGDAELWEKLKDAHIANHEAPQRHCGRRWVAEIELCPRCGLDAGKHLA